MLFHLASLSSLEPLVETSVDGAANVFGMVFRARRGRVDSKTASFSGLERTPDCSPNVCVPTAGRHSPSALLGVFNRGTNLPPNPHLDKAILGMAGLQAVVSILPGFRQLLGTAPMGPFDLVVLAGSVLGPLVVNEAMKPPMPDDIILDEDDFREIPTVDENETPEGDLT